ncbi:MAG: hypothetical protein JKY15_06585 [Deltaproteobacteria bacterium]|nr:hypothetical protein [Deltaproteobacteria bacterium]
MNKSYFSILVFGLLLQIGCSNNNEAPVEPINDKQEQLNETPEQLKATLILAEINSPEQIQQIPLEFHEKNSEGISFIASKNMAYMKENTRYKAIIIFNPKHALIKKVESVFLSWARTSDPVDPKLGKPITSQYPIFPSRISLIEQINSQEITFTFSSGHLTFTPPNCEDKPGLLVIGFYQESTQKTPKEVFLAAINLTPVCPDK